MAHPGRRRIRLVHAFVLALATNVTYPFHIVAPSHRPVFQRQRDRRFYGAPTVDADEWDDESIQNAVSIEQLIGLCEQYGVSSQGTKLELLQRLRDHATSEATKERERILARATRVQEGSEDSKERYEIISDEPDDGDVDDDGFFYFNLPPAPSSEPAQLSQGREAPRVARITRESVTAPPPPSEANALGERVSTVYSTTDTNDMTAISASQPGRGFSLDILGSNAATAASLAPQPWDMQKQHQTSETSTRQIEQASEKITELVATLLATTGAPGFVSADDDDDESSLSRSRQQQSSMTFVGFSPAKVPSDLLTACSQALRTARGEVLADVLRQFELQAIGYDGMAGDNTARGGGHYREVSKVRAFLEGFRKAEVRRLARETTTLLLDTLMFEGVEGLDITLSTMVRSSDDTEDYAGALNDSLLDFLNDSIRQQEKKVSETVATPKFLQETMKFEMENDPVDSLWDVTMEDGQRVETLDPNDPAVRRVLETEAASSLLRRSTPSIPDSAAEKMLLLLRLLRERVKAEATFGSDEKGRNLRLLAYCLQMSSYEDRKQLVMRDIGTSLDRLDSFIELVASSIEYGKSTSYELQPAKKQILNIRALEAILELATTLRRTGGGGSSLQP